MPISPVDARDAEGRTTDRIRADDAGVCERSVRIAAGNVVTLQASAEADGCRLDRGDFARRLRETLEADVCPGR